MDLPRIIANGHEALKTETEPIASILRVICWDAKEQILEELRLATAGMAAESD